MKRASELCGLPVLDAEGRQLGTVREVLVSLVRARLVALVVPEKVLAEPGLIPLDGTIVIGSDEVRVPSPNSLLGGEEAAKIHKHHLTLDRVRTLRVMTRSGDKVGNVEDLVLDGAEIVALELSDGLIQDIFQGRDTIELPGDVKFAESEIIVPDGAELLPPGPKQDSGTWQHGQGF